MTYLSYAASALLAVALVVSLVLLVWIGMTMTAVGWNARKYHREGMARVRAAQKRTLPATCVCCDSQSGHHPACALRGVA